MTEAQFYTLVIAIIGALAAGAAMVTAILNRMTSRDTNATAKATAEKVHHLAITVDGQLTEWKRAQEEISALKIIAAQIAGRSEGMEKERATPMVPAPRDAVVVPSRIAESAPKLEVVVVNEDPIPVNPVKPIK